MNHYKWVKHNDGTTNIMQCGFHATSKYWALPTCTRPDHDNERVEVVDHLGAMEIHVSGCKTCVANKIKDLKEPIVETHKIVVRGNEQWRRGVA